MNEKRVEIEKDTAADVSWYIGEEPAGKRPIMLSLEGARLRSCLFVSPASARELAATLLRAADDEDARAASGAQGPEVAS